MPEKKQEGHLKSEQDQEEAQRKIEKDKKEQERQDLIKKEEAAESQRTRCKICKREIAPVRRCLGHGGGNDNIGGGGSEEKVDGSDNAPATFADKIIGMIGQVANAITQAIDGDSLAQHSHQLTETLFNPEIISEMLSKKVLLIENDRDSGILTIKLQCNPNVLSEEQSKELKKFVDTLLKELDEFKKEKGISTNCAVIEKDTEGRLLSCRITLQKPAVYDTFIQRLASKNLLPMQVIKQQEKKQGTYQEGMNHFSSIPLSTKLPHDASKKVKETDEAQHSSRETGYNKNEEKSSSIRPRSPTDKLKPKGFK